MLNFTLRNLKVYFRDKANVFFSFVAALMTVVVYALFLRDVWLSTAANSLHNGEEIMDSWLMAGTLSIIPVTAVLGAFSAMVEDRRKGIDKDFICSPLNSLYRIGGYILSVFIIGMGISLFGLCIAELYIYINKGALLTLNALFKVVGVLMLSTAFSTVMMYFICSFFKSYAAFLSLSVVVGVLVGFLTGCYVPIGMLPDNAQWIVKLFPPAHSAAVLRQIMMSDPLDRAFAVNHGFTAREWLEGFLGVTYKNGDNAITTAQSLLFLAVVMMAFALAAAVRTVAPVALHKHVRSGAKRP